MPATTLDATSLPGDFHPAVADWFGRHIGTPTAVQAAAWPAIRQGGNVLIAAPTGSGKTLSAFLTAIDDLVRAGSQTPLEAECHVLYVSPLKALSNDIHKNLQRPIEGIANALLECGKPPVDIRAMVRTGDTPQSERERMRKHPPHIVVTTPESLFILLTSESGRALLSTVSTVIIDEIHALAGNKRGAHLALSLARLDALTARPAQRIGLSATQKPIENIAKFLSGNAPCRIVDTGYTRKRDLGLVVPQSPLSPVMANEVWAEIYDDLTAKVETHSTTLIFVNTRRLAERAARHLADRLGEEHVTSHHGSLSREHRLEAEQKLKGGQLKALVATASLELGIDIGDVDLVCQIGSPRGIAAFLQRVGRSGHAVGATPKGRIYPTTLDELVECTAMLDAVHRGELDALPTTPAALDVLAQQVIAEVACQEWDETALYAQLCSAQPYAQLDREHFGQVLRMLADGYTTRRGRRGAYIHRDAVNGKLRSRRASQLVALTNGGVIPDQFDYDVVMVPQGIKVGTLNEDFAFESIPGDIFQLGNQSYKIQKVESGRVLVEDAHGQPPTVPFWLGEAPGRTDELSFAVSRLRNDVGAQLTEGVDVACTWVQQNYALDEAAATQLVDYLGAGQAALGTMPCHERIVLERFFDETGDMHLVVHSTYGSRINKAWGLALRKRFCRKFNFELQAAALEDSIVLSLGVTHSFPLDEVSRYLNAKTVRDVLIQALLDAPMFPTRWRWNASIALAVRRHLGNRKSPPVFQRNDAEDLMAVVFPDQIACLENLSGPREVPDHPLVQQTIDDCLNVTMDIAGLESLLTRLARGDIQVICADLSAPSPFCGEILNARPYSFLDDGDAENRRTMAVQQPRLGMDDAARLRRLDPAAIERVREEAWPVWRDADELHDALVIHGFLTADEIFYDHDVVGPGGEAGLSGADFDPPLAGEDRSSERKSLLPLSSDILSSTSVEQPSPASGSQHRICEVDAFRSLAHDRRAAIVNPPGGAAVAIAAERLQDFQAWNANLMPEPAITAPPGTTIAAAPLLEIIRGRLEMLGPVTAHELGLPLGLTALEVQPALLALEGEGFVIRGNFSAAEEQWCERRLLARIHRYTLERLRANIEPVSVQTYMRFLLGWQGLSGEKPQGNDALLAALDRLEGYSAPASAWEAGILPARIDNYQASQLDGLCAAGKVAWARISPRRNDGSKATGPVKHTPVAFAPREALGVWSALSGGPVLEELPLSGQAREVLDYLQAHGASFFSEITDDAHLLKAHAEQGLGELVGWGLVHADTFGGLRSLILPQTRKPRHAPRTRRRRPLFSGVQDAGRWSLLRTSRCEEDEAIEHFAWATLSRYGVVFRKILEREASAPPWRKLLYVLWRMEARGEIRGGRFVDGFAGEQFALPEAVEGIKRMRKKPLNGETITISAADPCNLVGTLIPGKRPAPSCDITFCDGLPLEPGTEFSPKQSSAH